MHPKHVLGIVYTYLPERPASWYDAFVHRGAMCGQAKPRHRQMKTTSAKPEVSL